MSAAWHNIRAQGEVKTVAGMSERQKKKQGGLLEKSTAKKQIKKARQLSYSTGQPRQQSFPTTWGNKVEIYDSKTGKLCNKISRFLQDSDIAYLTRDENSRLSGEIYPGVIQEVTCAGKVCAPYKQSAVSSGHWEMVWSGF